MTWSHQLTNMGRIFVVDVNIMLTRDVHVNLNLQRSLLLDF